jgi:uncharacterized protein (TIRG00374 family)
MALGLGLLIYLGASGMIDWRALAGLGHAWPLSLAALGCVALAGIILIAWRLCLLMRPHGLHVSFAASIRLTLIGLFFNTCLPGATGGDVVKIYYAMEGNRGRRLEIATIMMLDRVAGLLGILGFTLLLVPLFQPMLIAFPILKALVWAASGGLVIVLAVLWGCTSNQAIWHRVVAWMVQTLPGGDYLERIIHTLRVYRAYPGVCCQVIGAAMAVHLCMTLSLLLTIQATHPAGADSEMMLLIPIGFVANSLPVTPGGLGVGEAAFDRLFQMAGFTGGAVAILGWRVLMIIVGLPGIIFYLLDKTQAVVPEQTRLKLARQRQSVHVFKEPS